jgi:hypothetical protein
MKKALVLFLLTATTLLAADGPELFPADYTPHPCAPDVVCTSVPEWQFIDTAALKGFSIESPWLDANYDRMIELTRPACAKLATCYATPGNLAIFCVDVVRPELISLCDRFPKGSKDYEQCGMFMRIFAIGVDMRDKEIWTKAQACAAEKTPPTTERTMKAWLEPADFSSPGYKGSFRVYAVDAETKTPVMAEASIPNTRLRAGAPGGRPLVSYDIKWEPRFVRVPNAAGHTDLVIPKITLTAPNYTPVTLDVPLAPGKLIVEMTPPAGKLKRGKNTVTVKAHDAVTNQPVELRVLLGETVLGDTNKPLEIEIKRGQKRPEIWATSLFDLYSDVVVAPAEK